ncbi:MAG: DegV family protein [Lachnospiraceae bacterium]|jgi:DegV family protein with EDD domain|nr:DegV family protein [Lachnospiraceae bacterium]
MAVRIIVDSASDVSQATAKEWGITVVPLKVRFGDDEYQDGKTLSNTEFYERLIETDVVPKTSQIPPAEYIDEFENAVEAGDEVVCLVLSSGVSGCFQSATIASSDFEDKIHLVDTRQFSLSYYILVEYAVRLRDEGKSAAEIAEAIENAKSRAKVLSVFDTLEYLKAGGRLSSTAAFVGNVLSIKPVITITDGVVEVIGKARGSKNGNNILNQTIDKVGGIDFSMPICFGYTGLSDDMLQKYIRDGKDIYEGKLDELKVVSVGATIGTYAGPGAIAVAFFMNE